MGEMVQTLAFAMTVSVLVARLIEPAAGAAVWGFACTAALIVLVTGDLET
jgi:hypothetical protein